MIDKLTLIKDASSFSAKWRIRCLENLLQSAPIKEGCRIIFDEPLVLTTKHTAREFFVIDVPRKKKIGVF